MAERNYTDIEMCRCLYDFDWNLNARVLPRQGSWAEGAGEGTTRHRYASDFRRYMQDLVSLGCSEEMLHTLLHQSFVQVASQQHPDRKEIKNLVKQMREVAKTMRRFESTGFLWIDDVERFEQRIIKHGGTEEDMFVSRLHRAMGQEPSPLKTSQRYVRSLKVRAGQYEAWVERNVRRRVDIFERLPSLLIGLYVHYVTGEINAPTVTGLLNAVERRIGPASVGTPRPRQNADIYRREIKEFEADCPRAWERLKVIFDHFHPSTTRKEALLVAAERKAGKLPKLKRPGTELP